MLATTAVLFAALIATAVVHALGEVRRLRAPGPTPDPFVTRRRVVRRVVAAVVLCVLLAGVFLGVNYGSWFLADRATFVRYWTACLGLVLVMLLLAFLDLRETRKVASREMRLELERALRLIDHPSDEREQR